MKRRMRKFAEGGNLEDFEDKALPKSKSRDLEDFEDKAMPKRYSALDELASGREKGSFDQDVYERAKRFVNRGGASSDSSTTSRAASAPAKAPAKMAEARASEPSETTGQIPGAGSYRAPASDGSRAMSDTERNVLNTLGAVSGLSGLRVAAGAARAAQPTSRALATTETPVSFLGASGRRNITPAERIGVNKQELLEGPKAGVRVQGKAGPKQLPPAKADADLARETARAKRTGSSGAPRSRNTVGKDEEMTRRGFSKGGSVRGGGCEQRGKTKGRFV